MKRYLLLMLLFVFSLNMLYAQSESRLSYGLFNCSRLVTGIIDESISYASQAVWGASQLNGNVITLTGTLTQSTTNLNNWTYSASPKDKLIAVFASGVQMEFVWTKFQGYVEKTYTEFTQSHDIDLTVRIANSLNLHIISKTYPTDKNIQWQRHLTGTFLYQDETVTLNSLSYSGSSYATVDAGWSESEYYEQYSGSLSTNWYSANLNDSYYSHMIHNAKAGQFTINRDRISNSSAIMNRITYKYENARLRWASGTQWADSARLGIYNEVIDPNYWIAAGNMTKNDQPFGNLVFDMPAVLLSYGPTLILKTTTGQNYLINSVLRSWVTQVEKQSTVKVTGFELFQNYPNPFNPSTNIKFSLQSAGAVKLKVFDLLGNQISVPVDEYLDAGTYNVKFDGRALPSGIYYYRLEVGKFSGTKKFMLVK